MLVYCNAIHLCYCYMFVWALDAAVLCWNRHILFRDRVVCFSDYFVGLIIVALVVSGIGNM